MKNLWSDKDAQAAIEQYGAQGIGRDLALRVYTTRLLGGEPELVLHGGGNTSVKTTMTDLARRGRSRCCASRAAAGTWARSSRRACRPCGWQPLLQAARARQAVRRGHGRVPARATCSIRRRPTRRSRRCCTPSCRTNSSTTRTPTPSSRLVDQPDGEELCARGLRRPAWASCPTSCRASRSPRLAAERVRARARRSRA